LALYNRKVTKDIPVQAMKSQEGVTLYYYSLTWELEVSGQVHVPATLPLRKRLRYILNISNSKNGLFCAAWYGVPHFRLSRGDKLVTPVSTCMFPFPYASHL